MHKFAYLKKNIDSKKKINISDITFLRTSKKNGLRRSFFETKKNFVSKKNIKKFNLLLKSNLHY